MDQAEKLFEMAIMSGNVEQIKKILKKHEAVQHAALDMEVKEINQAIMTLALKKGADQEVKIQILQAYAYTTVLRMAIKT